MKILVLLIVYILTLPLQIRECDNIKNGMLLLDQKQQIFRLN